MKKDVSNSELYLNFRKSGHFNFVEYLDVFFALHEETLRNLCDFCDIKCDNPECKKEVE